MVWWQEIPSNDLASLNVPGQETPPAHRSFRVIYRSTAIDGTPNVESAAVYVPTGLGGFAWRPLGGWKIAAWDHATTGGADICAPSRVADKIDGPNGTKIDNPDYYMHEITGNEIISNLLAKNLVNVKVDYEGLGTPGKHPYLIAKSLGRSTIDAVKATRAFLAANFGTASTDWAVAGQSEGGIAALGTSSLAATLAPELNLKGTLAAVPPVNNKTMVFDLGIWTGLSALTPLGSLMVQGAAMGRRHARRAPLDRQPLHRHPQRRRRGDVEGHREEVPEHARRLVVARRHELLRAVRPVRDELQAGALRQARRERPLQPHARQRTHPVLGRRPRRRRAAVADLRGGPAPEGPRSQRDWKSNPYAMHPNIVDNSYSGHDMADWIGARLGS